MINKIDLHVHTCYSDGSLTPEQVVRLAADRKLKAIAISDHDSVAGVSVAVEFGGKKGVEIIPAIEFSSKPSYCKDSVHILGYFIDIKNKKLLEYCDNFDKVKKKATIKRIELVNKHLGSDITYEEVCKTTKGTPTIVLYEKGYVKNVEEGISLFIKNGPCHIVVHGKILAEKAIKIIHNAGGLAVLAHLFAYKHYSKYNNKKEQEKLVKYLVDLGLEGVEVIIPDLTVDEKEFGKELCDKYGLIMTGGSDFHDEKHLPNNKLGGLEIDYSIVEVMKKKLGK